MEGADWERAVRHMQREFRLWKSRRLNGRGKPSRRLFEWQKVVTIQSLFDALQKFDVDQNGFIDGREFKMYLQAVDAWNSEPAFTDERWARSFPRICQMLGAADPTQGMSLAEFIQYQETYRPKGQAAADLAALSKLGVGLHFPETLQQAEREATVAAVARVSTEEAQARANDAGQVKMAAATQAVLAAPAWSLAELLRRSDGAAEQLRGDEIAALAVYREDLDEMKAEQRRDEQQLEAMWKRQLEGGPDEEYQERQLLDRTKALVVEMAANNIRKTALLRRSDSAAEQLRGDEIAALAVHREDLDELKAQQRRDEQRLAATWKRQLEAGGFRPVTATNGAFGPTLSAVVLG
jgi:hypothetical protein